MVTEDGNVWLTAVVEERGLHINRPACDYRQEYTVYAKIYRTDRDRHRAKHIKHIITIFQHLERKKKLIMEYKL